MRRAGADRAGHARQHLMRAPIRLATVSVLALLIGCGSDIGGGDERLAQNDPQVPVEEHLDPVMLPSSMPAAIGEIFPATGDRGRVLNRCSTCHSVVCAAIGQRTPEEWDAVQTSHASYIPGLSLEDYGKIFIYLRRNFNDTLPEPQVPPELLADACPRR